MINEVVELGAPILRSRAAEVRDPLSSEVKALISDLLETMQHAQGVGIAAPQIGIPLRVMIVASKPNDRYPHAPLMDPTPMINPVLEWASPELHKDWEGCLSIPGLRALVPRAQAVRVRYLDYLSGEQISANYSDFIARIWQHEFDHLEGVVFLDRVTSSLDFATDKEFRRMLRER